MSLECQAILRKHNFDIVTDTFDATFGWKSRDAGEATLDIEFYDEVLDVNGDNEAEGCYFKVLLDLSLSLEEGGWDINHIDKVEIKGHENDERLQAFLKDFLEHIYWNNEIISDREIDY